MKSKRSKRWDNGVKARLIGRLCKYDADARFEMACRGLQGMQQTYTQRQLKQRLAYAQPFVMIPSNKRYKLGWPYPKYLPANPVATP